MHQYHQILTYGFVAQDLDMLHEGKYLLVSDTSTSAHDTHSISKMFLKLKSDFHSLFRNEKNLCRYLVLDLSWASIHAAISQLNNENFFQYKERIFSFS